MPDFLRVEDGAVRSWFLGDKESCGHDRVAPGLGNELVGHQDPPCRGKPRTPSGRADERPALDRDRAVSCRVKPLSPSPKRPAGRPVKVRSPAHAVTWSC